MLQFYQGILQTTNGMYNINPWTTLNLDRIGTFMDYYSVVIGPGAFNYSLSHGKETLSISAICEYGKLVLNQKFESINCTFVKLPCLFVRPLRRISTFHLRRHFGHCGANQNQIKLFLHRPPSTNKFIYIYKKRTWLNGCLPSISA